jgi:pilus assembly protein CpaE
VRAVACLMIVLVSGNDEVLGFELQEGLQRAGQACSRADVLSLEAARTLLRGGHPATRVFVVAGSGLDRLADAVRQLRVATRAPLVAVSRGGPVAQVLDVIRAGASDYLDAQGNLCTELPALLARLREREGGAPQRGKTICVAAASGGCGASTLAVNLAAALAGPGRAACLIDLNVRGGDLATLLNLQPQHTLVDLCFQGQRLDETMFQHALLPHPGHMALLAAPPVLGDQGGVDSEVVAQVCSLATDLFPHVVIDLEDVVHREQARAVRDCDLLLVALRFDFPCILRTRRLLDFVREGGIPAEKIRLVANRCGQIGELPQRKAVEALGLPLFHSLPEDHAVMLASVNVGNPVVLEAPHSKVSKAFRRLAELVISL